MTRNVKWRVNSVEQYDSVVGSNSRANHGFAAFDIVQIMETEAGSGVYEEVSVHTTVVLPSADLQTALDLPTAQETNQYIKELLSWQLYPAGEISANTDSERQIAADQVVADFDTMVGSYPIDFNLPEAG